MPCCRLPSNGDDTMDSFDNSELMPIGMPSTSDIAPVPIRLGKDDVNAEISKLKLRDTAENDSATNIPQQTTTTTTIITSKTGTILSTRNEDTTTTALAPTARNRSPMILPTPLREN